MKLQARLDRVEKHLGPVSTAPLILFLRETEPGLPVGERIVWNGTAREIVFDPATGWPPLPPGGPHAVVLGLDPDWV
ncbi:MAG TPA: hypothetical protein VGL71_14550 [Urbifossiella sp.]